MSKKLFRAVVHVSMAATLVIPQISLSQAPQKKWIFPGDPLPEDLGFVPLKVGSTPDSEVQVMPRDWFLLKDKNVTVGRKVLEVTGPVLDAQNGQFYYRMVTGMILKAAMLDLDMRSGDAQRFVERNKAGFDRAPLAELGELPQGFRELYMQWNKPGSRLDVLPKLILPLAIAYDQSNFQHFFRAGILNGGDKSCTTIATVPPLAAIQTKIEERKRSIDALITGLEDAEKQRERSAGKQSVSNLAVTGFAKDIDRFSGCIGAIRERISNGGPTPNAACLTLGREVMLELDKDPTFEHKGNVQKWDAFVSTNLVNNGQGDLKVANDINAELTAEEAISNEMRRQKKSLESTRDQLAAEVTDSRKRLEEAVSLQEKQKSEDQDLSAEDNELARKISELEDEIFKLRKGETGAPANDQRSKEAVNTIPAKMGDVANLRKRRTAIAGTVEGSRERRNAVDRQVTTLTTSIDKKASELRVANDRLDTKDTGINASIAKQEEKVQKLTKKYNDANIRWVNAEAVLNKIIAKSSQLSTNHGRELAELKAEQERAAKFEIDINKAKTSIDTALGPQQTELKSLQGLIANYIDENRMGWFLESACESRDKLSGGKAGIYLARAKVADTGRLATPGPVDGGRWGLFNLDHSRFQTAVNEDGVLLNLPKYIQTSVHQINDNYEFALTQTYESSSSCADDSGKGAAGILASSMRKAFVIWTEGSDNEARAKGLACGTAARNDVRAFLTTLSKLAVLNGTVLDSALPKSGQSKSQDLIERNAITALAKEFSILAGFIRSEGDSNERRDTLIKALIKVLANDYDGEVAKQNQLLLAKRDKEYVFATPAPVRALRSSEPIAIDQTYAIKTLAPIKLYKAPIAKPDQEAGISLSLNDKVRVVGIDGSNKAINAGWVKVVTAGQTSSDLWMEAWPISTSAVLDQNGQEMPGITTPEKCTSPRLVRSITNFKQMQGPISRSFERMWGHLQTEDVQLAGSKRAPVLISRLAMPTTSRGDIQKTYIACEVAYLTRENQLAMVNVSPEFHNLNDVDYRKAIGVRIVEARKIAAPNGQTIYAPVEELGGYVHTWLPNRTDQPRIIIGEPLDPATWTVKR